MGKSPHHLTGDAARRTVRELSVFRHRLAASIAVELNRLAGMRLSKSFQDAFANETSLLRSAHEALMQPIGELPPTTDELRFDSLRRAMDAADSSASPLWADVLGEK
jgi:hypothetical protein